MSREISYKEKVEQRIDGEIASFVYPDRIIRNVRVGYETLKDTLLKFSADHGFILTGGLAYFAFLSVIPLFLLSISVIGFLLQSPSSDLLKTVLEKSNMLFPSSNDLITDNVSQLVKNRKFIGGIAIASIVFVASNLFAAVESAFNSIWGVSGIRGFMKSRIIAISMILIAFFFFYVSIFISILGSVIATKEFTLLGFDWIDIPWFWRLVRGAIFTVMGYFLFYFLYKYLPARNVPKKPARIGAMFSTVVWLMVAKIFSWVVINIAQMFWMYGSLAAVMILIIWFYFFFFVLVLGAELSSVVYRHQFIKIT